MRSEYHCMARDTHGPLRRFLKKHMASAGVSGDLDTNEGLEIAARAALAATEKPPVITSTATPPPAPAPKAATVPARATVTPPSPTLEQPTGKAIECKGYRDGQQVTTKIPLRTELPRVTGTGSPALRALQAAGRPEFADAISMIEIADDSKSRTDFTVAYMSLSRVDSNFARQWHREFSEQYDN